MTDTVALPQSNPHHSALEKIMDTKMTALQKNKEKKTGLQAEAVAAHQALMDGKHPTASHSYMGYGSRVDHRGRTVGGRKRRRRRRRTVRRKVRRKTRRKVRRKTRKCGCRRR